MTARYYAVADRPFEGPERRREPRYPVSVPITYVRGANRTAGTCLDISTQGLLVELESDADGAESELVRVEIAFAGEPSLTITAAIARRVGRKLGLLIFGISGDAEMAWRSLVIKIGRTRVSTSP